MKAFKTFLLLMLNSISFILTMKNSHNDIHFHALREILLQLCNLIIQFYEDLYQNQYLLNHKYVKFIL